MRQPALIGLLLLTGLVGVSVVMDRKVTFESPEDAVAAVSIDSDWLEVAREVGLPSSCAPRFSGRCPSTKITYRVPNDAGSGGALDDYAARARDAGLRDDDFYYETPRAPVDNVWVAGGGVGLWLLASPDGDELSVTLYATRLPDRGPTAD